jgi:UDP:flavonoid glycosyltransferase YjiC (YdhE family)
MLFTLAGGSGHLAPLVPLARAAAAAGHEVAFSARPWMAAAVEAHGFPAFAAGTDLGLAPVRRPLAAVDVEREIQAVGPGFGRRVARERAAGLLPLCASWRPDLLVCEELDFGAMVAAERLALPHATVLASASAGFVRPELVAGPLGEVRAAHGLAPDPELASPARHLVLSPFPPSLRDPGAAGHAFRGAAGARPPGRAAAREAPTVYFTLGTVFNVESGDLFQRVVAGLRELPIRLVVSVGRDVDPAELGPQPAHVRVERWISEAEVLPACRLVVSHGGSGSVLAALAHGLPMALLPLGADQPLTAARCASLGVARVLDPLEATPRSVREAAASLLGDEACRRAAERVRAEIEALPGPAHAARLLERLAAGRRAGAAP